MTVELGKLITVDPREVWKHEAHDFTPWLLDNAEALAEAIGIDLELHAAEHPVGGFSLDLIGRDLTNNCVLMVENQLAPTDHGHLGQVLTYAAGTEAGTVVWIATTFREEHRLALDFLNGLAGEQVRFFGIELSTVRIGTSPPAPLFRLRAQPNDWHAQVAAAARSGSLSGRASLYQTFWARFLERIHTERPNWTKAQKPQTANWISMPCPFKGSCNYGVAFASDRRIKTELYIDFPDGERALALYHALEDQRHQIESAFGGPLSWEELPNRRACRIAVYGQGDVGNTDEFDAYIDWFIDTGTKLRSAIDPHADVLVNSGG
jgi:hypothetical protein